MPLALFAADPPRGGAALLALWPIWLPLAVGGFAIFWLLPRPRPKPPALGVCAGLLALLLAGNFLVRTGMCTVEALLFYAFSGLTIVSGTLLITQHNPARSALSFALVVLCTCGLFLLLAAPFLMAATIIIYAGAIVVTFLFVLMLAQQEGFNNADDRSREPLLAVVTGFVLLAAILYVLRGYEETRPFDSLLAEVDTALATPRDEVEKLVGEQQDEKSLFNRARAAIGPSGTDELDRPLTVAKEEWYIQMGGVEVPAITPKTTLAKLRKVLLLGRQRLTMARMPVVDDVPLPLSAMSGAPANTPVDEIRRDPATLIPDLPAENSAYLGRSLFTDFLLPVELGGTLLLVATVGAIAIAQKRGHTATPRVSRNGDTPGRVV